MKVFLTGLTFIISLQSFGQFVKLAIQNPAPRVNDEIEVSVSIKENDSNVDPFFDEMIPTDNHFAVGKVKFYHVATDTGTVLFGPFVFTVNGKEYISDSLSVKVYPRLPPEKRGLWVRHIQDKGQHLLIIEQRVFNEGKTDKTDIPLDNKGLPFAEIDKEAIKQDGIAIVSWHSSSKSQVIDDSEGSKVVYKLLIYEIELTEDFKGNFTINEKHFKYFPGDAVFNELKLTGFD